MPTRSMTGHRVGSRNDVNDDEPRTKEHQTAGRHGGFALLFGARNVYAASGKKPDALAMGFENLFTSSCSSSIGHAPTVLTRGFKSPLENEIIAQP